LKKQHVDKGPWIGFVDEEEQRYDELDAVSSYCFFVLKYGRLEDAERGWTRGKVGQDLKYDEEVF
jgi:hypothetical protein